MKEEISGLTKQNIESIARVAANETINTVFTTLGIGIGTSSDIRKTQRVISFLYDQYDTWDNVRLTWSNMKPMIIRFTIKTVVITVATAILTSALGFLYTHLYLGQ